MDEVLDRVVWRGYKIELVPDHDALDLFGYQIVDPSGTILTTCLSIQGCEWFNEPDSPEASECKGIIDGDIEEQQTLSAVR